MPAMRTEVKEEEPEASSIECVTMRRFSRIGLIYYLMATTVQWSVELSLWSFGQVLLECLLPWGGYWSWQAARSISEVRQLIYETLAEIPDTLTHASAYIDIYKAHLSESLVRNTAALCKCILVLLRSIVQFFLRSSFSKLLYNFDCLYTQRRNRKRCCYIIERQRVWTTTSGSDSANENPGPKASRGSKSLSTATFGRHGPQEWLEGNQGWTDFSKIRGDRC